MYGMGIKQIFFLEKDIFPIDSKVDLIRTTPSILPMERLIPIETLQKDLTKNEEELFNGISKSARKRIKQVPKNENLQKISTCSFTYSPCYMFNCIKGVFVEGAPDLLSWTEKYHSIQLCSTFLKGFVVNILVTVTCVTIEPNHEIKCSRTLTSNDKRSLLSFQINVFVLMIYYI